MLCLTGSPPLTVFSVTTYLTPASTSNKTPSKTSSTTDLSPLAPVPRSKAVAISRTAASVNTESAPWNRTSLRYCWTSEFFGVWRIRRDPQCQEHPGRHHRQPSDDLRDQPERFEVFRLRTMSELCEWLAAEVSFVAPVRQLLAHLRLHKSCQNTMPPGSERVRGTHLGAK